MEKFLQETGMALEDEKLSPWQSLMKEMVFAYPNCFIHGRCEYMCLTQGEPEIKYLLQEGMPRKGSSLVKYMKPK